MIWVLTLCRQSIIPVAWKMRWKRRRRRKRRGGWDAESSLWLLSLSPAVFPDWTLLPWRYCQCRLASVVCSVRQALLKHRAFVCTMHPRWPGFNRKVSHLITKKEMLLLSWPLLWNLKNYLTSENVWAANCHVTWTRTNYSIKSTLSFNLIIHWSVKFGQTIRSYPGNENIPFQITSVDQLGLVASLV